MSAQLWGKESSPGKEVQVIGAMVSVFRDLWFSGKRAGRKLMTEKELFSCF